MMYIGILFVIAITAVVYDCWICPADERWGWRHALLSTAISVVLGFLVAMSLYQLQSSLNEKKERQQLTRLLQLEFSKTIKDLQGKHSSTNKFDDEVLGVRPAVIQTVILDDAVRSGLFSEFQSRCLVSLSLAQRSYNTKLDHYLRFLPLGSLAPKMNAKSSIHNLEKQRKRVLALIDICKEVLAEPKGRQVSSEAELSVTSEEPSS